MARYLVTGGAGFIGSHLVDALIADGHTVRVLDDMSTGKYENLAKTVDLLIADVADEASVRHALDGVDGCFHLAAIASVERGHREWSRAHNVNLGGTIHIFEGARRVQAHTGKPLPVVYASSAAVYGDPTEVPISECAPTNPVNAYGVDKLGCDLHAAVGSRVHGLGIVGLRFFNVYGPRQDPRSPYSGVISVFCERISKGLAVDVHGDGKQVRDFVFVGDTVEALRLAMRSAVDHTSAVFNVCSGVATSIKELASAISRIKRGPFSPNYVSTRLGDIRVSVGNPALAHAQLGFRTRISLEEGLAQTVEWLDKDPA
jgi:UDP-glucose 4-epimerase